MDCLIQFIGGLTRNGSKLWSVAIIVKDNWHRSESVQYTFFDNRAGDLITDSICRLISFCDSFSKYQNRRQYLGDLEKNVFFPLTPFFWGVFRGGNFLNFNILRFFLGGPIRGIGSLPLFLSYRQSIGDIGDAILQAEAAEREKAEAERERRREAEKYASQLAATLEKEETS